MAMPDIDVDPSPKRLPLDRVWFALTLSWLVAFLAIGAWCTYWADLRGDQYQHIRLGKCITDGGLIYVDCWENKPPGIAWLNAVGLALSPTGRIGVWVLPATVTLLSIAMFWITVSRLATARVARTAVALAAVIATMRLYDAPSINPDSYSFAFELAAGSLWLLAAYSASWRGRVGLGLTAGLLWSAATAVKQIGCVGLLAASMIAIVLLIARNEDRRRWITAGCSSWIGFLIGGGAVAFVLWKQNVLAPAWEAIFTFNQGFLSADAGLTLLRSWPRMRVDLEPLQFPLWLSLLAVIFTCVRGEREKLSGPWVWAMALWWLVATGFALLGPSHSMRYWQGTWAPMLLLAGFGLRLLDETVARTERSFRAVLAVVFLTLAVLLCRPLVTQYVYGVASAHVDYSRHPNERDRLTDIGERVQKLVPEGERIYVLAYHPGVYLYADRQSASRFTDPRSPQQMNEILADLAELRPYCILAPERPAAEFEAWCDETCHAALDEVFLHYTEVEPIEPYQVWLAKSAEPEPEPEPEPE